MQRASASSTVPTDEQAEAARSGGGTDIISKALASILSIAAQAPEDLEGLLFGRHHEGRVVIESFLLTGRRESACCAEKKALSQDTERLVANKDKQGMRLVGWCSIRCGYAASARPVDHWPTLHETAMHDIFTEELGDAAIGCVVMRGTTETGTFVIDSFCFAGPSHTPLTWRVRNVGSTSGGQRPPPLPGLGALGSALESKHRQAYVQALDAAVDKALDGMNISQISQLQAGCAQLQRGLREARELAEKFLQENKRLRKDLTLQEGVAMPR